MTPWVHNNRISVSQSVDRIVELWSRSLQKFTWADRISFLSAISTSIMLTAYNDNRDSTCWSTCTRLHGQKLCKAGRQNTIMLLVLVTCGCLIKWLNWSFLSLWSHCTRRHTHCGDVIEGIGPSEMAYP